MNLVQERSAAISQTVRETTRRPRVVIVGAGFGGLNAAKALGHAGVDVTVLDRNNFHTFLPLLYQVATAGLEPESIVYPVRAILRRYPNVDFQMAQVSGVDFERRLVQTDGEAVSYDYLILAAGSSNNYFGHDSFAEHTYGLKDIDDAERLRNRILSAFEQASRESDPDRRAALLTFVQVGGGPTGVELSGAIAELVHDVLRKDFPALDVRAARIVLVEAAPNLLGAFGKRLQRNGLSRLRKMGVEVLLNASVQAVEPDGLTFADGTRLAAGTIVWAAGVRGAPLVDSLSLQPARGARIRVSNTLQVPEQPDVYVIGDMAYLEGFRPGVAYPMVAAVAMQQGRRAARNILARERGRMQKPFHYFDRGSMATIGRRAAVFESHGLRLTGFIAWLGWLLVHLVLLVGFRNRLLVLANWTYSYFTFDRAVRLIIRDKAS